MHIMLTMANIVLIIISNIAQTVLCSVMHCVDLIYRVFQLFEIALCFAHFGFYEISTSVMRPMETMVNIVQVIISDIGPTLCRLDLQCFPTCRNCSLFCTFLLLRNFYPCDAHHANYGKHSLNNHFQQCAHSVYEIYSVLKLFKIAVCFAHFCFCEISTLVMRIMLSMANIV